MSPLDLARPWKLVGAIPFLFLFCPKSSISSSKLTESEFKGTPVLLKAGTSLQGGFPHPLARPVRKFKRELVRTPCKTYIDPTLRNTFLFFLSKIVHFLIEIDKKGSANMPFSIFVAFEFSPSRDLR